MEITDTGSLARTIDAVTGCLLLGWPIPSTERDAAAAFIASRQGLPDSYRGMFAPTPEDFAEARLFTGERLHSRASTAHILSEEAMRALLLLGVETPEVCAALDRARQAFHTLLPPSPEGRYCCFTCSVSLWRNLSVAPGAEEEQRLADGVSRLRARRADGKWCSYPFHYAVLALTGIELPEATDELRYAASAIERALKARCEDSVVAARRKAVMEKALERC